MKKHKFQWVTIVFSLFAVATFFMPGFVLFKKNRLLTSEALSAPTCFSDYYYFLLGMAILVLILNLTNSKRMMYISGLITGIEIVATITVMANSLQWIPVEKESYSRLSIGPSMWLWLICVACILIKINELTEDKKLKWALYLLPIIGIGILACIGQLNGLGILVEYQTIKAKFWKNILIHVRYSLLIMLVASLIGIPLGYLMNKHPLLEKSISGVMNVIETVPGISFITILMIPLSALANRFPFFAEHGISGLGIAPAFIALTFYALYPILQNTRAAFRLVDDYYMEVAEALGMNRKSVFLKITLPMTLPTIIGGLRIAMVFTITGFVLAAFIGGGGLGFYMITPDSMDLILLALIPMVIMIFVIDNGLKWVETKISYRR